MNKKIKLEIDSDILFRAMRGIHGLVVVSREVEAAGQLTFPEDNRDFIEEVLSSFQEQMISQMSMAEINKLIKV